MSTLNNFRNIVIDVFNNIINIYKVGDTDTIKRKMIYLLKDTGVGAGVGRLKLQPITF